MYGIYANIGGILMVNVTIYSSTMDPMGNSWVNLNYYNINIPLYVPVVIIVLKHSLSHPQKIEKLGRIEIMNMLLLLQFWWIKQYKHL